MRYDLDLYADNLMYPEEVLRERKVPEQTVRRIIRLRDVYNYMLRNPLKKDREYIEYIQASYCGDDGRPLSRRCAYEDLEILHGIVGNLQMCSKEWHRWRFNAMIMEGYAIAVRKQDAEAIARLAAQYGKYNKLDKDDEHDRGYSEIPHIDFTFDVTVMGFQPIPDVGRVIDALIAKYSGTALERIAEDAVAVEVVDEPPRNTGKGLLENADTTAVP